MNKKFFTIICTLALVFVSVFSFVGCTNDDLDSVLDTNTTFTYVHLLNNSTGFTTDPNETSISIGVVVIIIILLVVVILKKKKSSNQVLQLKK